MNTCSEQKEARMTNVVVRGLTKAYGPVTAVRDLTFTAPAGTITAFLGPNGSGKTTTLRMILGLAEPAAGTALIGGVPYRSLPQPRRQVGALLEHAGLHPGRRARDHLRVLADSAGLPARRADEVLAQTGLAGAGRRRAGGFSLGMRQRLGLAAALLGDPGVLLLDEPVNGLDPAGIAWLRDLLRGLAAEGRTVLVASHLLGEVAQVAGHVVIVSDGQVRFAGPLREIGSSTEALESAFLSLTAAPAAN
jgi:ABC-2 type transport system ATP-binding protein